MKTSEFLSENFQVFFGGEIFCIFEYACFRNDKNRMTSHMKCQNLFFFEKRKNQTVICCSCDKQFKG